MSGAKIIEGLKEAVAGNFYAVTIEGQRWVRQDRPAAEQVTAEPDLADAMNVLLLIEHGLSEAWARHFVNNWNAKCAELKRERGIVEQLRRASPAPADQANEIGRWKNEASKKDAELTIARSQLETERRTVETMDNNHRSMAALLADTGRERDELAKQLVRAKKLLKPFADCVFNDNGDVTVTTSNLSSVDYFAAYKFAQSDDLQKDGQ